MVVTTKDQHILVGNLSTVLVRLDVRHFTNEGAISEQILLAFGIHAVAWRL